MDEKISRNSYSIEQIQDALRRSYVVINDCNQRSYFYMLAMG